MAWQQLTEQEKRLHPLFTKFTFYQLFIFLCYLGCLILPSQLFGFENKLLDQTGEVFLTGHAKEIYSYISTTLYSLLAFKVAFLVVIQCFQKTKTAIKFFIAFLIVNPILTLIVNYILMKNLQNTTFAIIQTTSNVFAIFGGSLIIGGIFALYYHFSKAFNVQYLGRVKT